MTDTAGLFKPLVWEDSTLSQTAKSVVGTYKALVSNNFRDTIPTFNGDAIGPSNTDEDAVKAICQADYESRILSTLNLDAFKSRIRTEALEEAAVYCETHAVERATRNGTFSAIQSPTTKYSTHQGSAYGLAIRALKECE